jgi:hypothetical protein
MTTLGELAAILRSKNAGIGYITLDVLFRDQADYDAAKRAVTPEAVAAAYGLRAADLVAFAYFDAGLAIKVTLPRPRLAGGDGVGETDLYGSGQYAPLLELAVPDPPTPSARA